jgi:predicted transcriptional regulator
MPPPTTTMTIRLPAELVEALDAITAAAGAASSPLARVSRNATALEALRLGLAELERRANPPPAPPPEDPRQTRIPGA